MIPLQYRNSMFLASNGYVGIGVKPKENFQIGNTFTFHDGGNKVISFMQSPRTGDLSSAHYSSEIRFDPNKGELSMGVSTSKESIPTTRNIVLNNDGSVGIGINKRVSIAQFTRSRKANQRKRTLA